jgi:hypothetical protein
MGIKLFHVKWLSQKDLSKLFFYEFLMGKGSEMRSQEGKFDVISI